MGKAQLTIWATSGADSARKSGVLQPAEPHHAGQQQNHSIPTAHFGLVSNGAHTFAAGNPFTIMVCTNATLFGPSYADASSYAPGTATKSILLNR
jgi:hypothetical protein